jgi:hypothetical protein
MQRSVLAVLVLVSALLVSNISILAQTPKSVPGAELLVETAGDALNSVYGSPEGAVTAVLSCSSSFEAQCVPTYGGTIQRGFAVAVSSAFAEGAVEVFIIFWICNL